MARKKNTNQVVDLQNKVRLPALLRQRVERHLGKPFTFVYRVDEHNPNVLGAVDAKNEVVYFDVRTNKQVQATSLQVALEDASEPEGRAGTSGEDIGTGANTSGGNYAGVVTADDTNADESTAAKKVTKRSSTRVTTKKATKKTSSKTS